MSLCDGGDGGALHVHGECAETLMRVGFFGNRQ